MNLEKKSDLTRLSSKSQRWINLIVLGLMITIGISIVGCKKENNDEYYVKYEVDGSTIYIGGKLDATINSETNVAKSFTISQGGHWEVIIGPVQKGFNASLKVVAIGDTHDKLKLYTNIYVSKNDSPFAMKTSDGSDTPRNSVELYYTIIY